MNRRGSYYFNLLKGLDYGLATLFGIPAGIYISGYCQFKSVDTGGKFPWPMFCRVLNWMFHDPKHCTDAMAKNLQDIHYYYYGDN